MGCVKGCCIIQEVQVFIWLMLLSRVSPKSSEEKFNLNTDQCYWELGFLVKDPEKPFCQSCSLLKAGNCVTFCKIAAIKYHGAIFTNLGFKQSYRIILSRSSPAFCNFTFKPEEVEWNVIVQCNENDIYPPGAVSPGQSACFDSGRKLENPKKTHRNTWRKCETPNRQCHKFRTGPGTLESRDSKSTCCTKHFFGTDLQFLQFFFKDPLSMILETGHTIHTCTISSTP